MFGRLNYDACFEYDQDRLNAGYANYTTYLPAYWRANTCRVESLAVGVQPDFYGPVTALKTRQESFLQGRGQPESSCASCEVRYLPSELFPSCKCGATPCVCFPNCRRTDLQPAYTRLKRSCNDLSETDASVFQFFPENFQTGYVGFDAVVPQYHGRLIRERPGAAVCGPLTSFGGYDSGVLAAYT
jgi:hypothetical protein